MPGKRSSAPGKSSGRSSMPTEEEITKAKTFLSKLKVPAGMGKTISMETNEDGSVTVTNLKTGAKNTITVEQAVEALNRR